MAEAVKKKKKRGMPTSFTILIGCLIFVAICTWIVAAFTPDVSGATLAQVMRAPFDGFKNAIDVCLFVIVLGGFLAMVNKTGALDAGIATLVRKLGDRDTLLIPVLMLAFGICGSTYGMMEETIPFYILLASVTFAMGFDSMVGALVVLLGAGLGTLGSTVNPFSAVIASNAAGTVFTEGIAVRAFALVVGAIVFLLYLHWYAKKVKADPKFSYSYEDREKFNAQWELDESGAAAREFGLRKKIVLVIFVAAFIIMIVGVMNLGWWFPQMAAEFVTLSILVMFIGGTGKDGVGEAKMVDAFGAGASSLVPVALIIGLARGVLVIADNGMIIDTILNAMAMGLADVAPAVYTTILYVVENLLTILVPSSSSLAALTMPIFGPLTELVGLNPEGAVTALCLAEPMMTIIAPTSAILVAGLAVCKISLEQWWKTCWKWWLLMSAVCIGFTAISAMLPVA